MKKSIWFIVNPISGKSKKKNLKKQIEKYLDHSKYDFEFIFSSHAGNLTELAQEAIDKNINILCVAGGDGSVREAGKVLKGTDTILSIIPVGSGNGFARHFKIPLKVKTKKIQDVDLMWHLVRYKKFIVTIQFPSDGIWGNLWGFPNNKPSKDYFLKRRPLKPVVHLLTHKKIHANFFMWEAINKQALNDYAASINGKVIPVYDLKKLAMPRLITKHILPIISTL